MKIAVVGPVAPYRSGIARHTTALVEELAGRENVQVSVYTFMRQFPARLYPGGNQVDGSLASPCGAECVSTIDSIAPLSWIRTAQSLRALAPDLVVVPAWTFFVAPALGYIARDARRHGISVTMIVHNAFDHEGRGWKDRLMRYQLRQADRLISHNASLTEDIRRHRLTAEVEVCPHPIYDSYPDSLGTLDRRAQLELLFFGLVRPYKGLNTLIDAMASLSRSDVRLTIAGEFWVGLDETRERIARLGLSDVIELVPQYISDQDTAEMFARADAVVAPYHSATGSGVLALAQRYECPVIASDIPSLREAVVEGETGWLFPAGDAAALADLISNHLSPKRLHAMKAALHKQRSSLSWARFADAVIG